MDINFEFEKQEKFYRHLECAICKRAYKDLLEYKRHYLKIVDELIEKIEEKKLKIQEIKGFTYEKLTFMDNIKKEILNMNLEDFLKNRSTIIAEKDEYKIIYNFLKKREPFVDKKMKIKNIINIYKKEADDFKELKSINNDLDNLAEFKNKIIEYIFCFRQIRKYNIFDELFPSKNYEFSMLMETNIPLKIYEMDKQEVIAVCPFCQRLLDIKLDDYSISLSQEIKRFNYKNGEFRSK